MEINEINIIINELILLLKKHRSDFKGIYFFGSRNRDNWNQDSDLDLLFAYDNDINWKEKNSILDLIYELELKYNYFIDPKIYKQSDIQNPITPFRENVLKESSFYAA